MAEPLPAIIIAPFFVTYLVRTLAWLNILADEGPVVGLLRVSTCWTTTAGCLATTFAVVSGITYNFFPFMALPLYVSLEQIDPRTLEAAKDLYASPIKAFQSHAAAVRPWHRRRHAADVHSRCGTSSINAQLLGTPNQQMIGNVIQAKFLQSLDYPTAASLSFILMALILVGLLIRESRRLGEG